MKNQWLAFFYGTVHVKIKGLGAERFLNRLSRAEIPVWGVRRQGDHALVFTISLNNLHEFRKLARSFEGRVSLTKGQGFPFLLKRGWKSSGFVVGIFAFFVLLFILSNIVWRIDIHGASPEKEYEIRKNLSEIGIQKGKIKFSMEDPETVQKQLLDRIKGVTWIGVKLSGSTYRFEVVEKNMPKVKKATGPQHLIASKNAVIVKMFVEKGEAVVKKEQFVKKGQLLVTGYIGNETDHRFIASKGKVLGETWYKTAVEIPLKTSFHVLSGDSMKKHYIGFGRYKLPIWGFADPAFKQYSTDDRIHTLSFLGVDLPISYEEIRVYESETTTRTYSPKEAEVAALESARKDIKTKLPEKAVIIGEKILQKHMGNDKVKLLVHFQVLENIAVGQPIIQGDVKDVR